MENNIAFTWSLRVQLIQKACNNRWPKSHVVMVFLYRIKLKLKLKLNKRRDKKLRYQ